MLDAIGPAPAREDQVCGRLRQAIIERKLEPGQEVLVRGPPGSLAPQVPDERVHVLKSTSSAPEHPSTRARMGR
jgi:hypothetical protein